MGKTYKIISSFEFGKIFIEYSNTLEYAKEAYNKAIKDECEFCYLLETEVSFPECGDSINKILDSHKRKY